MDRGIPEADWRHFRALRPIALERFCTRVLDEVGRIADDASRTAHERYLAIHRMLRGRDEELADAFDDARRSTAVVQLARICRLGVLTEEEMAGFGPGTRESVRLFLDMWRS